MKSEPLAGTKEPFAGRPAWLLVDDDEGPLGFLASSLALLDIAELHTFRKPSEALSVFARAPGRFQLVITDFDMPVLNGLELFRQLRVLAPTVKVILTSGGPINTSGFALESGFSAFLAKPFSPLALWRTLDSVLPGQLKQKMPNQSAIQ